MVECVQCGYCCKVAPCAYGTWNSEKQQCTFLTEENFCGKYERLITIPGAKFNPAFGTGCSSSLFNADRDKKIMENIRTNGSKS